MTKRLRVTTDPKYFEEHADSLKLKSPGAPMFPDAAELAGQRLRAYLKTLSSDDND